MSAVTASLCSTLLFVGLFVFVSADPKNITVQTGKDATLTCQAPNYNTTVVKWSRVDLREEYVLLYRNGHFDQARQHPSFKHRVDLQDRQMKDGDVSLILNNVTTADSGTYECRVFMSVTNNDPISIISLSVVDPPGQTGGHREDGGKEDGGKEDGWKEAEGKEDGGHTKDGSVGLIVGLSVSAVLVLLIGAVVGFLLYSKKGSVL